MNLQNIGRKVIDNVLINISPSTIFLPMLLSVRFYENYQAVLAVVSIYELIHSHLELTHDLTTSCMVII